MELYFFSSDTFTASATAYSLKMQTLNVLLELRDTGDEILHCSEGGCCSVFDNPICYELWYLERRSDPFVNYWLLSEDRR